MPCPQAHLNMSEPLVTSGILRPELPRSVGRLSCMHVVGRAELSECRKREKRGGSEGTSCRAMYHLSSPSSLRKSTRIKNRGANHCRVHTVRCRHIPGGAREEREPHGVVRRWQRQEAQLDCAGKTRQSG